MSKPLKSFPESARKAVAMQRATQSGGGLGKVSALDFLRKKYPKVYSGIRNKESVTEKDD